MFESGQFPETWSDGLVKPLHKKGNHMDTNNYRGITLLSMLGKLFTRVINIRLDNWANDYHIYIEAQFGFRQGRSTVDCMFVLNGIINKFIQNSKKLFTFFVDFSKAFDYVVRENLWYKLIKCGVQGKILNVIMSMYSSIKNKVYHNGEKSESFDCNLGVRQGECLSPFLFAMYVNDMEERLSEDHDSITIEDVKLVLLLYADDLVLISDTPE